MRFSMIYGLYSMVPSDALQIRRVCENVILNATIDGTGLRAIYLPLNYSRAWR